MLLSDYMSNLKIKIYTGNFTLCPDVWSGMNTSNAFHKLYFTVEGSALISSGNQCYELKAGEMMLIPKGVTHSFRLTKEKHLRKYWLHFSAISEGNELFAGFPEITVWDFKDPALFGQMSSLFDTFFAPSKEPSVSDALIKQASLFSIFSLIFNQSQKNKVDDLKVEKTKSAIVIAYIEEHLQDTIKVETLAKLLYMHPTAFIRYFRNQFGIPPLKYIKCLRLERAKFYLETTDIPIGEIAEKTGFGDLSHLSRDYKATYGMTPGQGRRVK